MPKKQPRPRPVGRPRSIPAGAVPRAIRMTELEYLAVLAFLAGLRSRVAAAGKAAT